MAKILAAVCLLGTAWAMRESDPYMVNTDECCSSLCSEKPGCTTKCRANGKDVQQTINLHVCTRGICKGLSNRDKAEMEEAKLSDEELQSLGDEADNAFPFADDASLVEAQNLQDELASMLQYKTDSSALETKGCSYPCDFCADFCTALGEGLIVHRLCKWKCMWNIQAFRTDADSYCKVCGQYDYTCTDNTEPAANGKCQKCGNGRGSKGGKCSKCQTGKQGAGEGKGCKDCADRYYQDEVGAESCKECKGNNYVNEGRTACRECGLGKTTDGKKCQACGAGKYQIGTECQACVPGKYQTNKGQTQCENCTDGEWTADTGATTCLKCLNKKTYGMYTGLAHAKCKTCERHTHPWGNMSGCEDCPEGKDGHVYQGRCDKCAEGKFKNEKNNQECTACGENTEQNDDATGCKNCTAGYFRKDGTNCQKCWAGYWCPADLTGPHRCDDGQGTPGILTEKGSKTQEDCKNCSAGEYSKLVDGEEKTQSCVPCPAGHYQDSAKMKECISCPPGRWTSGTGKANEADCDEANCRQGRLQGGHICEACNEGFTQKADGCQPCIDGCKECNILWSQQKCGKCKDGFRQEKDTTCTECEVVHCTTCPEENKCQTCDDKYDGDPNKTKCTIKPVTTDEPKTE